MRVDFADRFRNFKFVDPSKLVDRDLELILAKCIPANPSKKYVPAYSFDLRRVNSEEIIGKLNLRAASTESLEKYVGHIGYTVNPDHRGHHYAERACRIILPILKLHGFTEISITCNPDNFPSRRTCERLGAQFVEIVNLPIDHEMYVNREGLAHITI